MFNSGPKWWTEQITNRQANSAAYLNHVTKDGDKDVMFIYKKYIKGPFSVPQYPYLDIYSTDDKLDYL